MNPNLIREALAAHDRSKDEMAEYLGREPSPQWMADFYKRKAELLEVLVEAERA